MVQLIFFTIIIFYPLFVHSKEVSSLEKLYFNFLDLNNDKYISYEEINQSINIVFQLIDKNQDHKVSLEEVNELKEIIELMK